MDSLKGLRGKIAGPLNENKKLSTKNNELTSKIEQLEEEINNLKEDKGSISLFGQNIEKSLYNTIMWSCIVVLAIVLAFFMMSFKSRNANSKKAKRELAIIEKEFEEHRKKSLKKEQEIMRKLQDEINKNNS